jgi:preprotein translocase subunit SecF
VTVCFLTPLCLAVQGLKLGIDFTGGTLVEIGYKKAVNLKVMRAGLEAAGINDATVQHFGSSFLLTSYVPLLNR